MCGGGGERMWNVGRMKGHPHPSSIHSIKMKAEGCVSVVDWRVGEVKGEEGWEVKGLPPPPPIPPTPGLPPILGDMPSATVFFMYSCTQIHMPL